MLLVVGVVGAREQSRLICPPAGRIAFNLEAAAVRGQSGIVGGQVPQGWPVCLAKLGKASAGGV